MWLLYFIIIVFLEANIKRCFAQQLTVQYKDYLLSVSMVKYSSTTPALHTRRRLLPRPESRKGQESNSFNSSSSTAESKQVSLLNGYNNQKNEANFIGNSDE